MLKQLFSPQSPYKKRARNLTIVWTLLIFILCFIPGQEFPDVHIPMADKWVHFVLFAVFSFLWLCAGPTKKILPLLVAFVAGALLGWIVEELQGVLVSLGRSKSIQDIYADMLGSAIGVAVFCFGMFFNRKGR